MAAFNTIMRSYTVANILIRREHRGAHLVYMRKIIVFSVQHFQTSIGSLDTFQEKKSRGRHGAAVASIVGSQSQVSGSDSNFTVELARSTGACMSFLWLLAPTVQGHAS